jgi:hypothetical protein
VVGADAAVEFGEFGSYLVGFGVGELFQDGQGLVPGGAG